MKIILHIAEEILVSLGIAGLIVGVLWILWVVYTDGEHG